MCESVISVNPEEEPVQRPRRSRRVPVQRRQTSGGGRTESDMSGLNVLSVWFIYVCFLQVSTSLPHVERYDVIKPRRLQQRHRRSLKENQVFPDSVSYELEIEGRNHTIHLEKNSELIGKDFTEIFYTNDGKRVTTSPDKDHCFYHGRVEGVSDSVVSVGICSGLSGFVRARQQLYFIEPLGSSDDGEHAVYKPEHLKTNGSRRCGFNDTVTYDHEEDGDNMAPHAGLFRSRSWKTSSVSSPQRFVELFVVVDNTEYKRYGPETKSRILGVVNHVDKLYRPLNIRVVLVGLEIWSYRDYIDVDIDSETTLDHFLMWRQADLLQRSKHDNAQFVTGKDFDSDTVGLANKFAMCTENSGGVNQDHHHNPIGLASTIAHEMGHNFGLSHDDASCVCGPTFSSGNCVMADKLRTGSQAFPEFFSSCSLKQLDDFMERARPGCLDKPNPSRTIAVGPRCGNAMLDPGEECDCGGVEECKNPCCDAATCRLTEGSQCAHGLCCDNCQFRASGSVCRTSAGDCDLPEFCSGLTEDCPDDAFVMNGKPCFDRADGFCYNGRCPTHEQHCWRLFGPGSMVSPDICYDLNKRGEEGANCGKRGKFGFMPCAAQDFKCGSIFCGGGGESITGKRAAYTVFSLECKLAVDDDKTRRMDMVPKGAKCGTNKVCLDNKCVDVSVYGKKEDCAKKCNNKGVCNHKNECQCDPGWAPPDCSVQFSDLPPGQTGIITGVCAALSILLLITVVIAGLMRCKKDNVDNYTSKRKVHSAPGKLNPMFEDPVVKDRPQISQPTFMESTASQVNSPLMPLTPSRLPPQPPHHMTMTSPRHASTTSSTSQSHMMKPQAPVKPLPPLNKPPFKPVKPPVPPVKPSPPPAARRQPGSPPAPAPPAAAAKPRLHR